MVSWAEVDASHHQRGPGPLLVVQELVNTLDIEAGTDSIDSPAGLKAWLVERSLAPGDVRPTGDDIARVAEFREALRALLHANNGGGLDADDLRSLNRAGRGGLRVRFGGRRRRAALEPQAEEAIAAAIGGSSPSSSSQSPTARSRGSRRAPAATAAGRSTTGRRTSPPDGAAWRSAAAARRCAPTARGASCVGRASPLGSVPMLRPREARMLQRGQTPMLQRAAQCGPAPTGPDRRASRT